MKTKSVLTQTEVTQTLAVARAEAQNNGWAVAIAVTDDGGHLLGFERLDGCAPIGGYIAIEKARTAALGRRESKGYEEMVNGGRTAFVTAPLLTSLEGGVPVIVVVWNNGGYLEIRYCMESRGITPEGVSPSPPDFAKVAEAYGIEAVVLDGPADLVDTIAGAVSRNVPFVIDVRGV